MTIRRSEKLSPEDQLARIRLLVSENKKLRRFIAKLEVTNISLTNENRALKKHVDAKANEKFTEMMGQIMQRVEQASEQSPNRNGSSRP